jgi:hypothetical protein
MQRWTVPSEVSFRSSSYNCFFLTSNVYETPKHEFFEIFECGSTPLSNQRQVGFCSNLSIRSIAFSTSVHLADLAIRQEASPHQGRRS